MKFKRNEVFEMVDALFHQYASSFRAEAKEELADMMQRREDAYQPAVETDDGGYPGPETCIATKYFGKQAGGECKFGTACPECGGKLLFGLSNDKWVCTECGLLSRYYYQDAPDYAGTTATGLGVSHRTGQAWEGK